MSFHNSTVSEIEEDFLKYLYKKMKNKESVDEDSALNKLNISESELKILEEKMVEHGYIPERKKDGYYTLTEIGVIAGEELQKRHRDLKSFLQFTCNLPKEQAEENACRIEHVVDSEVVSGIRDFLESGYTYEYAATDMDIRSRYDKGKHELYMSIYRAESRYPRILANEDRLFGGRIILKVERNRCYYLLKEIEKTQYDNNVYDSDGKQRKSLWYMYNGEWIQADIVKGAYVIPAEVLNYVVSPGVPVIEGTCIIGMTKSDKHPGDTQCRELNVHCYY